MKPVIETLATGDEVVNGDVVDSNAAHVSQLLAMRGLPITRHQALPDDRALLRQGIEEVSARADFCVVSGGLGPTEDDLTVEVAAQILGVELELNGEALRRMKERFARFNFRYSENNTKNAWLPKGCTVYQNEVGTAPAFSAKIGKCVFFFLPGPPIEFKFFVDYAILPFVDRQWSKGHSATIQLKTLGWGESHLAEKFEDYSKLYPSVKLGYRAYVPEVWLKLTAEAASRAEALKVLEPPVQEAYRRIGDSIFGRDREELVALLHQQLLDRRCTLFTAESCTGGRIGALLTAQAGSSAYYVGGVVTYSNAMKSQLLGVDPRVFAEFGAVSTECANAMALGALERSGSDYSIAVTGIAGPSGGTAEKPVGLVFIAIGERDLKGKLRAVVSELRFRGERDRIQRSAAMTALELLRRRLIKTN